MLHAEVDSDLCGIPLSQQESVTTLHCIIKQMVVKNQDARDALEEYLKEFDIRQILWGNVSTACLCLKAIATSLGNINLPKNAICQIRESFAKSLTVSFNEVCMSQLALRCGSISTILYRNASLHTQLIDVLNDLKSAYHDLAGGKLWAGVNAMPHASSFKTFLTNGDKTNGMVLAAVKHMSEDEKAHALAAVKTLPCLGMNS